MTRQSTHSWVFLEDTQSPAQTRAGRWFREPLAEIVCYQPVDLTGCLARMQQALAAGHHLAGWFSYECGYCFEPSLLPLLPVSRRQPLLWFGVFAAPTYLSSSECDAFWAEQARESYAVQSLSASIDHQQYLQALQRIQQYIAAGDVYQINYTFKQLYQLSGSAAAWYAALREAQPVSYSAYVHTADWQILSISPELFISNHQGQLRCQPMKGTAARGVTSELDAVAIRQLQTDPKNRAENVMIVDLLRNDLGKIAQTASVHVDDLFAVHAYRDLLQMTSSVKAQLHPECSVLEAIQQLFPCGSVTGAPKIRAMQIIRELEPLPRGVYCGAVGCFHPDGDFVFNVPIRTLAIDQQGQAELGVGSGIVADSDAEQEYAECQLKAGFVARAQHALRLYETLKLDAQGRYHYLGQHLARLQASARYFSFVCHLDDVHAQLLQCAAQQAPGEYRVRLALSRPGTCELSVTALARPPLAPRRVYISDVNTRSDDVYLFHKTNQRDLYDQAYAQALAQQCYEVLFVNERGELTEASRNNLFVNLAGQLYTPPLQCGLLPGVLRAELLASGQAQERILLPSDLQQAQAVFLGNSVRGLVAVHVVDDVARAY